MTRKEQIEFLKKIKDMLLYFKEMNEVNQNEVKHEQKEKQKVLVLTKKFCGKDIKIG